MTLVEGDLKAPFSISATLRCKGGHYSFLWIAPLYPWSLPYKRWMLSMKASKYHFLRLWCDSTWDWTQVFRPLAITLTIMPITSICFVFHYIYSRCNNHHHKTWARQSRVQILGKAVCISHCTNTLKKDLYPTIPLRSMQKQ